jgi:hypothetical protein
MKKLVKLVLFLAVSASALLPLQAARAQVSPTVPNDAVRQLMDFAEWQVPAYFPTHQPTLAGGAFLFRYYPTTQVYLVVAGPGSGYTPMGIYLLGGPFGGQPTYVGLVTDFVAPTSPGELLGSMSIGPICPVETVPPDPRCQPTPAMYAAHPVYVYQVNPAAACAPVGCDKGPLVATLTPDAQGNFLTFLPAGRYFMDVQLSPVGGVQGAPAYVTLTGGQTTPVTISIDTGIR